MTLDLRQLVDALIAGHALVQTADPGAAGAGVLWLDTTAR